MKKIVVSLLMLVIVISSLPIQVAFADDAVKVGDAVYMKYDKESCVLTFSGNGTYSAELECNEGGFKMLTSNQWEKYSTTAKKVVIGEGITAIDGGSFANFKALEMVELPKTLKTIGKFAFYNCEKLFDITLPKSLETIEYEAFRGCKSIKSFDFGESLKNLGDHNFFGCDSLEKITVDEKNAYFSTENGALYNKDKTKLIAVAAEVKEFSINPATKTIAEFAFALSKIKSVIIPKSVEEIGGGAFYKSSLENISFEKDISLKRIKTYTVNYGDETEEFYGTFESCSNLKSLILPESIIWFDSMSVADCSRLESIYFGENIRSITSISFFNCNSLKKITVSSKNKSFYVSNGALYNKTDKELIRVPVNKKSFKIKNNTKNISDFAFMNSSIKKITVPKSVQRIGSGVFYGCKNLASVKFEKNSKLKYIGNAIYSFNDNYCLYEKPGLEYFYVFGKCNKLKSLNLPDSLKYADWNFIYDTKNLKSIYFGKNFSIKDEQFWEYFATETSLKNIVISSKNKKFSSKNGVVYNKKKTKLLCYPVANRKKSFVVPSTVKTIGDRAFVNCKYLRKIKIPATVKEIGFCGVGYKVSKNDVYTEIKDKKLTVVCKKKSAAYKYAKNNKLKYSLYK